MNQRPFSGLIKHCRAPLTLFTAFVFISVLGWLNIIPSFEVLVQKLLNLFNEYGGIIIGPASFLENLAIVNFVFPGSIVILTAMALTAGNLHKAISIFILIWLGSLLGLLSSYLEGKVLSRYDKKHQSNMSNEAVILQAIATFWHPQFASMKCFAFGSNNVPIRKIILEIICVNFIWNLFWGILVYNVGAVFNSAATIKYLIFAVLICWLALRIRQWYKAQS